MRTHLALVALVGLVGAAQAEELIAEPRNTFGIDAAVVVPVGDYSKIANLAGGALARVEVPLGTGFVFGRAGVLVHSLDDRIDGSLTFVPIYAGYRHPFGTSGAYVAGELGI